MILNVLFGGQELIEARLDTDGFKNDKQSQVLSVAQDIVYGVSRGKKWTPKHIGLGSTLHQKIRSKKLIQLFHNAGHIVSFEDILRMDTSLAQHTLTTINQKLAFSCLPI